MLFSSTTFIFLFLPLVILVCHTVLRKSRPLQNAFLFAASLFFYAWGEPRFVFVMAASIAVNWLLALVIGKRRDKGGRSAKVLTVLAVCLNLALLFVFKYLGFTCSLLRSVWPGLPVPEIALPIGISFFTFQALSYILDVYRGDAQAQRNPLYVGLYIAFFPQLIAGPIVRYNTIADDIVNRRLTAEGLFTGFERFVVGLAKKVLLANAFAILADLAFDSVAAGKTVSVLFGWLGAVAYAFQILFDFSGYSDMAIGLGRMFGFRFPENFDSPYAASSVMDFWRRWHISLGTWFRDYLYIPLGGSRRSRGRNLLNLFIVWTLTGIWHGADLPFAAWGFMWFLLLAAERALGLTKRQGRGIGVLKRVYTLFFVLIGWILFRSASLPDALAYLGRCFGTGGTPLSDGTFTGYLAQNAVLLAIGILAATPLCGRLYEKTKDSTAAGLVRALVLICLFILSVASLVSRTHNPFIYFNF